MVEERPYHDEEWLRQKYVEEGLSDREIGEKFGVTSRAILKWRRKFGIDPRKRYKDEEWMQKKYVEEGLNDEEISELCGVHRKTVAASRRSLGIEPRYNQAGEVKYEDEDFLREKYHHEGATQAEIAELCGCSRITIIEKFKKFGIDARDGNSKTAPSMHTNHNGYERFSANCHGTVESVRVHQLVKIAEGADPEKVFSGGSYHVHHVNEIPWDNRDENLRLLSCGEHSRLHRRKKEKLLE